MRTYSPKASEIVRDWFVVDATDKTLGRLAVKVAERLRGKHKTTYTTHMDTGDYIIVTHVEKITVTGKKAQNKIYHRHTGYPGGIKSISFEKLREKNPVRLFELAIKGMLPKNPLGRAMFRKLKVYKGGEHPHGAQEPKVLEA